MPRGPPGVAASPAVSRGSRTLRTVSGLRSITTHRRPRSRAATAVVPDPANRSTTRSPGPVASSTMRRINASGLGVRKPSTPAARSSARAVSVEPTSWDSQMDLSFLIRPASWRSLW